MNLPGNAEEGQENSLRGGPFKPVLFGGTGDGIVAVMRLRHGIDLGYCTNIHRGETWEETFGALRVHTDAVRRRVAGDFPYGIGLRLSAEAAAQLTGSGEDRDAFRRWLEESGSYLFTVNGFPYGSFHGTRVKENVYAPDWRTPERLAYTNRLFDLLDDLAPAGREISVSTLPGSFKDFLPAGEREAALEAICGNLRACSDHIESIRQRSGRDVHLGLEPEPLGLFETSAETVSFFERLVDGTGPEERERILRNLGVNYDTCHLAVEFEEPARALGRLRDAGVRISKIHLSSALAFAPAPGALERLRDFEEGVYLHQAIVREGDEIIARLRDLPEAFAWAEDRDGRWGEEWRVHFHVPIHTRPEEPFGDTRDHVTGTLDVLADEPGLCRHFEMETYTWEVLPPAMRAHDVVDQLVCEYEWTLSEMRKRGLAD